MSLKPKKVSEIKKIEAKLKAKASKMDSLNKLPPYTMIVCEGVKTEPFYIQGFVDKVNERYKSISKEPHIVVYGTGRNTNGLIRFIDKMIAEGKWTHYKKFWLMYDKDDFPADNFDNTQFEAEARKDPIWQWLGRMRVLNCGFYYILKIIVQIMEENSILKN